MTDSARKVIYRLGGWAALIGALLFLTDIFVLTTQ